MINIKSISKSFGPKIVLDDINLNISSGQFTTIIGPNGSGKTTLLQIIATLLTPTTGQITINGLNTSANAHAIRHILGIISHKTFLYDNLTAFENLLFYAHLYNINDIKARINTVLNIVDLSESKDVLVKTFSHGMQQRLSIARCILHDPSIILCDEPYTGLDQNSSNNLTELLRSMSCSGSTILMITHNLHNVLELSDNLIILHKGKIAAQQPIINHSINELTQQYNEIINT